MELPGLVTLLVVSAFILTHTVVLTTCQFALQPTSVVQAQGLNAVFECRYLGALNHNWGLNGVFPTDDSYMYPPDVTVTPPSDDTPAKLSIPATGQYINTVVQCEVVVRVGGGFVRELSENATLEVQGPLSAVVNLTVNNVAGNCSQLNVTWVAPFSLNLTTAEPDIQYCVDVYNVTEERDNMLQSECNITISQYMFDVPYPVGAYNFWVTPRSNIDSSLNGTISTALFSYEPQAVSIDKVNFTTNTELNPLRVTFPKSLIHECRVPDRYSVEVQYIDTEEDAGPCICSTNQLNVPEVSGTTPMIVLDLNCSSCNITRHRRCSLTLLAESNLRNTPSIMTMDISTHDVYKVTDVTMEENEVSITVEYLPHSIDAGFVAIVHSIDFPFDIHYQVIYRVNTLSTVGNLVHRVYKLAVFDLNDVMKPERKLVLPAVLPNTTLNNTQYGANEPTAGGEGVASIIVNRTICISCNSSCVGIVHSQEGINQGNIVLTSLTVNGSGQNCTNSMSQGNYFAAIFKLSSGILDELPSYKAEHEIAIGLSTSTTASDVDTPAPPAENSAITAIGVAVTIFLAFLVVVIVIMIVWLTKMKQGKHTLSTSLLENEYDTAPPLNNEYSIPSEAAGGPPPIPSYQYENVELMSLTRTTVPPVSPDEPPPSYNAVATAKPFKQDMEESSLLSSTLSSPDHIPISACWTHHNGSTLEGGNHDTARNNRVTQASENEQIALHMELGSPSMENPTQQPLLSHSKQSWDTKPLEETTSSETANSISQNETVADEPHSQSVDLTPKEPVYDVAKKNLANSTPTQNNSKTENPVVYADLDIKPKANNTPPMQHPVVYALIDGSSLAPKSVEINTPRPCLPPSLPPPPTAESVLAEIYPIAKQWQHLGEALGIKEHHLDSFSTEDHEQVSLHDMIVYYFSFGRRSWEDIVKALWEIGETEAAGKIIRSGKCTVELPVTFPTENPPPLPPRNDTAMAQSHQTEAGELAHDDWQDHNVQDGYNLSTGECQDLEQSADQVITTEELDQYNSGVDFSQPIGPSNESEDEATGRKNNSLGSTQSGDSINKMLCFPTVCTHAMDDPIWFLPDKEAEPTVPYRTTMIHSLCVFEKLDVPLNRKLSALGYLNSCQSAPLKDLYQQRMSAVKEVCENHTSHVVPENYEMTIEDSSYMYTVKKSVEESSSNLFPQRYTGNGSLQEQGAVIDVLTQCPALGPCHQADKSSLGQTLFADTSWKYYLSHFSMYPTTSTCFRGIRFKGIQLLERGCIFQPENGDICRLEVVSYYGELELARQVQGLPLIYHGTSEVDELLHSQWLHNSVLWLAKSKFTLIQVVTLLLFSDQTFGRVLGMLLPFSGDL